MTSVRELSGVLSDLGKWESTWDVLVSEECSIQHLRVYHNQPEQLQSTCSRLLANRSVTALDVGVAEGQGCSALAELLMVRAAAFSLRIGPHTTLVPAVGCKTEHTLSSVVCSPLFWLEVCAKCRWWSLLLWDLFERSDAMRLLLTSCSSCDLVQLWTHPQFNPYSVPVSHPYRQVNTYRP